MNEHFDWVEEFDDRQRKEISLARLYERDYHHGTNGHNDLMIIAKMAGILNAFEREYGFSEVQRLIRSADE